MLTNSLDSTNERLEDASSVLVLSSPTPRGTEGYMKLVSTPPAVEANVVAVTYTLSPAQWLGHWRACAGSLPANLAFVHDGTTDVTGATTEDGRTATTTVASPREAEEIALAIDDALSAWDEDARSVVSFQTLTVLLAYVDLETAFRQLHLLLSRVEAAGAVGYYGINPDVHDRETIGTLAVLFDAVVEISDGDPTVRRVGSTSRPAGEGGDSSADWSLLSSVGSRVSRLWDVGSSESRPDRPETDAPSDGSRDAQESQPVDSARSSDVADERLLADRERIERLLTDHGGQMKQCDVVEATEWSRSTVSRKLTKMEEEGQITRVQFGRTNLVYLSGHEPSELGTRFDGDGSVSGTSWPPRAGN